jgi:hypothetical protein
MPCHSSRKVFFSAAIERNHDGPGIAEDTANERLWDKAGEPVEVQKPLKFCHRKIVTEIDREEKDAFP